jgi:hypothetical protein
MQGDSSPEPMQAAMRRVQAQAQPESFEEAVLQYLERLSAQQASSVRWAAQGCSPGRRACQRCSAGAL